LPTTSSEPRVRGDQPACPFCASPAFDVVGSTGIGNQISVLRCTDCDHEWEEVLPFQYRRRTRSADGAPRSPRLHSRANSSSPD
jgi:hypothetical protein